MPSLPYEVVDVFTDRPFTGNPLAVVFGAESLSAGQMQALAREFHLSETVFVLAPGEPGASYRVRIFTPDEELPFAGHPSIGAAVVYARRSGTAVSRAGVDLLQECGAGLLPIRVHPGGKARLSGGTPTLGAELDPAPLLASVGLQPADCTGPAPRPAGCGLEFLYLPVTSDAVRRASLDLTAARAGGVGQLSVVHWDGAVRLAHARVFCPGLGVTEDPATGSAALGLGVWLVGSGLLPADGESSYTVRQGAEIHRPSTLDCTVTAASGKALSATVTGHVVRVARGEIAVPPFVG